MPTKELGKENRLGVTFHRGFALNLPSISHILRISLEYDGGVKSSTIRKETNLGTIYIEAMPRYARGCGLLQLDGYKPTPFGKHVCCHDPSLNRPETLWLMHYHMTAPHGPGPAFWNHLIVHRFPIGKELKPPAIAEDIGRFVLHQTGKALSLRTIEGSASAFLGTYAKSDGLGKLGLLEVVKERNGTYRVQAPPPPPIWALAYALADYWDAHYGEAPEVLLNELGKEGGFASLFFLGSGMLGVLLSELQSERVLGIKRGAPPFTVYRLWHGKEDFLVRLYEYAEG